jgi:predicted metal-dependent HD superfamily phosphohydrolase
MNALGVDDNREEFHHLCEKHDEAHRRYHRGEHVGACLCHLDSVASLLERPVEMEVAFWFHDAIYEPFSATNEQDSADWARGNLARAIAAL